MSSAKIQYLKLYNAFIHLRYFFGGCRPSQTATLDTVSIIKFNIVAASFKCKK
jgi:hypothetical protein